WARRLAGTCSRWSGRLERGERPFESFGSMSGRKCNLRFMRSGRRLESFELDHTKVRAPYVRVAGRYTGERGDVITKYDLRLVQPNRAEVPTAALHTIEHLIAGYFRDALAQRDPSEVVDLSPMGCRTGFYLTVLGEPSAEDVLRAAETALEAVAAH